MLENDRNSYKSADSHSEEDNTGSHRLQLVMSNSSMEEFIKLRDVHEASFGEIVRRSLIALEDLSEKYEIHDIGEGDDKERLSARVQVVLPRKTFERLNRMVKVHGENASFSSIIRMAINLFHALTKLRYDNEPLPLKQKSNGKYAGINALVFTA